MLSNIFIYQFASAPVLDDKGKEIIPNEQEIRKRLIWKVASTCLAELAVASLTAGIACCFMATAAIPTMMTRLINVIAITTLFHSIEALVDYSLSCDILRDGNLKNTRFFFLKIIALFDSHQIRAVLFAAFNNSTHGVLIHELGHALLMHLLIKDAHPIIEIFFGRGGQTRLPEGVYEASKLGELLGNEERIETAITVAGPAFAILEATGLLMLAHKVKDKHPELRLHLVHMAIFRVVNHIFYALSALPLTLTPETAGHDFLYLWKRAGIHPVVAIVTMVAIPLFTQCALWKWAVDHKKAKLVG